MWPFKKKHEDAKPKAKKEPKLPSVEWTHNIGEWRKEEVCEHCGHTWGSEKDHSGIPCPTCGCIGSHKAQVVREECERTQGFCHLNGEYPGYFRFRGIDVGEVVNNWSGWYGIRNRKTVIWDGCSVKKENAKNE